MEKKYVDKKTLKRIQRTLDKAHGTSIMMKQVNHILADIKEEQDLIFKEIEAEHGRKPKTVKTDTGEIVFYEEK